MATITQTWNNSTPTGPDNAGQGDDRIREVKTATRERSQNAGQYWPDVSASADSGIPFISPDARHANEWNIYDKTVGNVPDTTRKLFSLTQTALTLLAGVAANFAGTLSEAGSRVLTKATAGKRILLLNAFGDSRTSTAEADRRVHMLENVIYVPQKNSDGSALVGTLKEFAVTQIDPQTSGAVNFDLLRMAASNWTADTIATLTFTTLMATQLQIANTKSAARTTAAASFVGAVFPTINGGDLLQIKSDAGSSNNRIVSAWVAIEVDWP